MTDVVERLAKRSAGEQYPKIDCPYEAYSLAYEDNARWWMNAIAEELEDAGVCSLAEAWLRTKAQEGNDG